jgi:hypothetical protein
MQMRLSDQIELLTQTLDANFVDAPREGESAGEAAARLLREQVSLLLELQSSNATLTDSLFASHEALTAAEQAILELQAKGSTEPTPGLCNSCAYMLTAGLHSRMCQNEAAIAAGFAKRGYPTPAGHGCPEWG